MEGLERPGVRTAAGDLSVGEDGGPRGRRRLPLRSAERAGQRLHVGGEHCGTVRAEREGHGHEHHGSVNTLPPSFLPVSFPPHILLPHVFNLLNWCYNQLVNVGDASGVRILQFQSRARSAWWTATWSLQQRFGLWIWRSGGSTAWPCRPGTSCGPGEAAANLAWSQTPFPCGDHRR